MLTGCKLCPMALKSGTKAWAGLAAYVVLWDAYAVRSGKETLSTAFYKGLTHPVKRWRVVLLWGYITAHLFRWLPERYDPLRRGDILQKGWSDYATYRSRRKQVVQCLQEALQEPS